jgi:hypothetical protein
MNVYSGSAIPAFRRQVTLCIYLFLLFVKHIASPKRNVVGEAAFVRVYRIVLFSALDEVIIHALTRSVIHMVHVLH